MNHCTEKKLIQLCTTVQLRDEAKTQLTQLLQTELNWETVVAEAKCQGVAALLYYQLVKISNTGNIPIHYLSQLKKHYLNTCGRNIVLFNELRNVVNLLSQIGIGCTILKGPALVASIYNDPGLRWSGDIDILIKKGDVFRARDRLLQHDYIQDIESASHKIADGSYHMPGIRSHKNGLKVELHWTIDTNNSVFNVHIDEILQRVQKCNYDGIEFNILSPEDMLLHLCLHNCYTHLRSINYRQIYDIAAVIEHIQHTPHWSQFVEYCRRYNIINPVVIGLTLAQKLFSAHVPTEVINTLKTEFNTAHQSWYGLIKDVSGKSIANIFLIRNFRQSVHYFLCKIFPSTDVLAQRFSLPPNSNFVYLCYMIRPFQLLKDHLIVTMKLIFMYLLQKISPSANRTTTEKSIQTMLQQFNIE